MLEDKHNIEYSYGMYNQTMEFDVDKAYYDNKRYYARKEHKMNL